MDPEPRPDRPDMPLSDVFSEIPLFRQAQDKDLLPQEAAQMAGAVMGQLAPLLLGAQVGTVMGYLGQRVLGQYDLAIPHPAPGAVRFVVANIAKFEREWSIPPIEF